jgi:N-acetylmuramoyl-L-alanine amidase
MYRIATEGGKWVNDDYVDYTPVKVETEDEDTFFRVVVGSFKSRPEAEIRVKELADKKVDAFLLTFIKDGVTFYRVVAGSYKERANADEAVANLKRLGFESFLAVYEG